MGRIWTDRGEGQDKTREERLGSAGPQVGAGQRAWCGRRSCCLVLLRDCRGGKLCSPGN